MLNRRILLQGLTGAAFAGGVAPAAAQGRPFTFCSFGGAIGTVFKTAFMDPAARKFGIRIANTSPTNYAKLKAMVEAKAVEWDLVDTGGQFIFQGRDQGLLEKLDYSIIDASRLDRAWVTDYGIYVLVGATVMAYNTKQMPAGATPNTWKDFWDVKSFPGPRTLYTRFYYNYEAALLAAGVPRGEVYPATEDKIKLALEKLREIKPHVKVWWTTGAQPAQLVSTGEVAMALVWSGRVLDVIKEGAPVAFTYEDSIAWGEAFVVPKGAPNAETAMRVINYAISEEAQEALLPLGVYGPVLKSAAAKATPDQAKAYVSYPANLAQACIFNDEEVARYATRYEQEWQKFLLS
ncbi:extracellular solute-binding protein family 1 [Methylobacterium sp. 4-46]|uniref:ABC transporter substrate-binding protein n=1 Tax=unclassified Methylobacterium TaxID=2615210 RepID=UPI000152D81C|nr:MULTISPECIES: ABC transporter substrate-binding protein [Methylobacterium]ACA18235.1 extracellular solute-binding protein family 1 [Methylobacterium sp. 4-46]WFT77532.1 ABC transporter substrate-binding protein [Methylobacterium nodulans]